MRYERKRLPHGADKVGTWRLSPRRGAWEASGNGCHRQAVGLCGDQSPSPQLGSGWPVYR